MNILEFLIRLIEAVSWPVVVVIVIIVLKKPLSQLVIGIKHFKYKDIHLDFNQEIANLEREAKKTLSTDENIGHLETIPLSELKIVAQNPIAAIEIAWEDVELTVVDLAKNKGLEIYLHEGNTYPASSLMKGLKNEGLVSEDLSGTFTMLRQFIVGIGKIKNPTVTLESAVSFVQLCKQLSNKLKKA